jgi:hypothetical protein
MIKNIIGLVIGVIAASYIKYLGLEFRNTNHNQYSALVFLSIFMYIMAGKELIIVIRKARKTK